jgi:DNA-binding protein H-NS
MAQTYTQIQKQIEKLQRQADALRDSEIKGVVERIKIAIAHYGLTASQLGLEARPIGAKPGRAKASKPLSRTAFEDGRGNAWSGRGPRPRWLREALETGRSIDEFRVGSRAAVSTSEAPPAKASKPAKRAKRAPSKVNYSDDAGHSWTGRGPKPGWLKAALDAGKSLQDFLK